MGELGFGDQGMDHCRVWSLQARPGIGLLVGVVASVAFGVLASTNLAAQGLYYDEVHQAAAAFAYVGRTPVMFNELQVGSIPLLNMSYSGAIKSNIYGLYLASGQRFSVTSWRVLGIAFVMSGILLFCLIASRRVSVGWLLVFQLLFLTDVSVLLMSRHDWGPVAMSLLLRLLITALWIDSELAAEVKYWRYVCLGGLVGIAIFEKLSSMALLAPLAFSLVFSSHKRGPKLWITTASGLLAGALPLVLANVWTYITRGHLISLLGMTSPETTRVALATRASRFIAGYLSLGQGHQARGFILADRVIAAMASLEATAIVAFCLLAISAWLRWGRTNALLRLSGAMTFSYLSVAVILFLFPRPTALHHWILGTPFQYATIACTLVGLWDQAGPTIRQRFVHRAAALVVAVLLLVMRLPCTISLQRSLAAGGASARFDPSFTLLAEFAARKAGEAVFIAADWGIGAQIYCMSGGQPGLVLEPFWTAELSQRIGELVDQVDKESVYLLELPGLEPLHPSNSLAIVRGLEQSSWREAPVDAELNGLGAVTVRKFLRR